MNYDVQDSTHTIIVELSDNDFRRHYRMDRESFDYILTILKFHFKNLKYKTINKKNFRPKRGTLRIYKAKNLLNYHPKFNLKSGINKYIEFLKKYG